MGTKYLIMKKLFSMFVAAGMVLTSSAQQTDKQVATLQHGDQTSVFYGVDAFKQAYDTAADTLDVITLSSGEFNVPYPISKSIAVYGAGFEDDAITGVERTYLNSSLHFEHADIQDGDGNTIKAGRRVNGVHIEGVYVNGSMYVDNNNDEPIHNLSVIKCRLSSISFKADCYDCVVRQSVVSASGAVGVSAGQDGVQAHNLLIANSYVYASGGNLFVPNSTILVDHCVLSGHGIQGPFRYTNNICEDWTRQAGSVYSNNIFISTSGTSTTATIDGSWYNMRDLAVWAAEGEDGKYAADKDFALKYPERYIGTDGTEIGLHGGVYAWNKIPSIPRITECSIDTKEVNKGTLKVSIKAEAQNKE